MRCKWQTLSSVLSDTNEKTNLEAMKLERILFENFNPRQTKKNTWELRSDLLAHLFTNVGYFIIILQKGFTWNGASVPFLLRWFLPNWDFKNESFNVLSALHDAAFATGGFGGKMTFDECNDFYRGGLREIGFDRFHASTACFCLNHFSKNHFGQDEYNVRHLVECNKISG